MEYSVGSLADLISGSKSDNKTKVVKQSFKKVEKAHSESHSFDKKKSLSKKKPVEENVQNGNMNENELPKDSIKVKRKVKTRKAQNSQIQENNSMNGKAEKEPERELKIKRKKRKLDKESDLIDKESESSPKEPKLSKNDTNAAGRIKNKINKEIKNSSEYKDKTLFVGNIPIAITKGQIKKYFKKYGDIDSVRIRGIAVADPKTSKKVAAIKKEFHPDRNSVCAFIRFNNSDDAKKAEAENGVLFFDHHLRVQFCESEEKPDESKAIFIGNLPFKAEDEQLWDLFKTCGPISHVRIVRDGRTGIGKGFGYVNFKDSDSVQFALERGTFVLQDRELRISLCEANRTKKQLKKKPRTRARRLNSIKQENADENKPNEQKLQDGANKVSFAGTKFNDMKKKKKFSKGNVEKRNLAKKLSVPEN